MKNKVTFLFAILLVSTVGFGCSFFSGGRENSANSVNSDPKTGVAECDEVIDLVNRDMDSGDDGYIAQKFRGFIVDKVREGIRKNIEENKGDKEKIARDCKKIKDDYIKNKDEKKNPTPKDSEKDKSTQKS